MPPGEGLRLLEDAEHERQLKQGQGEIAFCVRRVTLSSHILKCTIPVTLDPLHGFL